MNEVTKPLVMEALVRINKAVQETTELELMTEEGKALLSKLLGQ
jgi:hypothetical protein